MDTKNVLLELRTKNGLTQGSLPKRCLSHARRSLAGRREDHLVKDIRPPHAYNANSINKYKLAIMILIPNQLIDKVNEQGWRLISK